ncbi:NACHT, LRR and PYD domains-containing protein 3 [Hoplias malabaricus]|uniref:NACHT, LRR and PYD domains-containing protein 3 n=1 Tax=Hoplias malabaricus TaxID=27720 RepID=UPI003461B811
MEAAPLLLLEILGDLIEEDLQTFQWHLTTRSDLNNFQPLPKCELDKASREVTVDKMVCKYSYSGSVEIALKILMKINQNQLAEELKTKFAQASASSSSSRTAQLSATSNAVTEELFQSIKARLKSSFMTRFMKLYQGTDLEGDHVFLNDIFTELYVIKGCTGGVCNEHEIRQVEAFHPRVEETPIQFSDIFKVQTGDITKGTKVLTVGIAGVGKTVSVHKFVLDWAEGKSNQDIDLILFLPFRELNLIKDQHHTLRKLILYFHPELCDLNESEMFSDKRRIVFIFDGLDESRIPLNFNEKKITSLSEETTAEKLISNLIKGNLLSSALLWVTSRPAAVNQIPRKYFEPITEIRGFTNQQKEEYFRKRIMDPEKASRIYSHIKSSRSLHILCYIPVFSWIAASVLLQMLRDGKMVENGPTTLTEMYIRFLLFQTTQMTEKYKGKTDKRQPPTYGINGMGTQDILKLAKLAFLQLEKGQLIFYDSDLKDCDIDVDQALVYSGICTQIFRKDEKVFSFVHLSFQEFLAALHVFLTFSPQWNPFLQSFLDKIKCKLMHSLCNLHKTAVNKALLSENGQMDLVLRFLLGLSLHENQRLLKSLQPQQQIREHNLKDTIDYIKKKIHESKSSERCTNLFFCLTELKDDSLMATVQNYLSSEDISTKVLSSAQWSALVFVLQMSEEIQEKFELKKFRGSDVGLIKLLDVVKHTRRALLDHCKLSVESCRMLATVLSSDMSPMRELDLSNNDIQDSGTKQISVGLKDPCCKLEILRLCCCNLTEASCEDLASVLGSDSSTLVELDLSYNELGDKGVKYLSAVLEKPHCTLEIMRLCLCMVTEEGCSALASALKSNPSHLRELDLSYNHPGESAERKLLDLQEDPHIRLEKIRVDHGGKFRVSAGPRKYACDLKLDVNTAHRNIVLSENGSTAQRVRDVQVYPECPDRFEGRHAQVLCEERLDGRCYWEVEWEEWAEIAVTYRGIGKKEKNKDDSCGFGNNGKSWSLNCSKYGYSINHNKQGHEIRGPISKRVGVYLDWTLGSLSFYSVYGRNKFNHIHTFKTTFTEPLYVGFGVYNYNAEGDYVSSVSLCRIEDKKSVPSV